MSRSVGDKRRTLAFFVLFLVSGSGFATPGALACATCFGRADSPLADGMNMGILVLLGVVLTVLAAFASFFVFLARRAAAVRAGTPAENPTHV